VNFITTIDVDSLRALIGDPGVVILDCRFDLAAPAAGRAAYRHQHIPTARYVDLNEDLSAPVSATSGRHPLPQPEHLAARLAALGIGGETQVVAYDDATGAFAARAWWLLKWLGHSRVAVLDGGMRAWAAAGAAVESGEPGLEPTRSRVPARALSFTPRANMDSVVSSAEVIEALEDPERRLLDARAPERFAGTVEPIDPVAGHVPGAINHPFGTNLRADGHFLSAAELERLWAQRLGGAAPRNVIVMCGSGVTACHNLLAMEIAGFSGAKLYAGSWSEWIRDPSRPVSRGQPG
jgi:thiosulfate/3-mercaptopyruvate sulfurtransferase